MLDHALQTMATNVKCQEAAPLARWVESCVASGRIDDVAVFMKELLRERAQDRERLASLEARLEWLEASVQTDRTQMFGPEDERLAWNGIEEKTAD